MQEGRLHFSFPKQWAVRAYDEHRFYKLLSGRGFKGVDFLMIDPSTAGHLFLMEVKDYRQRQAHFGTIDVQLPAPEILAEALVRKCEHTLHSLNIINEHYNRRWWWPLYRRLVCGRMRFDPCFWTKSYALSTSNTPESTQFCSFILWMEYEEQGAITPYLQTLQKLWEQQCPSIPLLILRSGQQLLKGLEAHTK